VHRNIRKKRQFVIFFLFCLAFLGLILRVFTLQVLNNSAFKDKANLQHKTLVKLKPKRGAIYDAKDRILALDIAVNSVYANAREVKDKANVASQLATLLKLKEAFIQDRLSRDKAFVWIKRKISENEERKIEKANIHGISLVKETKRSYPNDSLGCHIIGFTDMDNQGLEGLELYYDAFLRGRHGWRSAFRDAKRNLISSYEEYLPSQDGYSLVLTVDEVIQHVVESEIIDIVKKHRPKSVMIVAMNPATGEILAMANYPNFNLNDSQNTEFEIFKNRSVTDTFEPGSVFKIITASAVLNEGRVSLTDEFYCEEGQYKIGRRVLHDYRPHANLTFREVIEKSSNIGTVKAAALLGSDGLYEYIKKFGYGARSGIDISGEENGILRHKSTWHKVDMTTIPMGQGISGTALQLVNAVSVIANGGFLMKPFLVKRIIDSEGNVVKEFRPHVERRVISSETASLMRGLLNGVVERGTGKRAKMKRYTAGGKTGTAQKVGPNGRYTEDKFVASFIGFAPREKPRVSIAVCVDEPKGTHFGGTVSAPAFKNIMQKILSYMEVQEDEKN